MFCFQYTFALLHNKVMKSVVYIVSISLTRRCWQISCRWRETVGQSWWRRVVQVFIYTCFCMLGIHRGRGFSRFMRLTGFFLSGFRSPSSGENRKPGWGGEKEGASSSDLSQGLKRDQIVGAHPLLTPGYLHFLTLNIGEVKDEAEGSKSSKSGHQFQCSCKIITPTITLMTVSAIKSQTCLWSPAVARLNLATQVCLRRNHMLCGNVAYFRRWGGSEAMRRRGREWGGCGPIRSSTNHFFFSTVGLVGCSSSVQPHPESFTSRAEDARPPGSTSGTKDSSSAERAATSAAVRGNCCSQMCIASLI